MEEGVGISRNWAAAHLLALMVGLRTILVLLDVSFSSLMGYDEHIIRLKV